MNKCKKIETQSQIEQVVPTGDGVVGGSEIGERDEKQYIFSYEINEMGMKCTVWEIWSIIT